MSLPTPTNGPFLFHPPSSWQAAGNEHNATAHPLELGDTLNLLTWNLDFSTPHACQRGIAALRHIQDRLSQPPYASSTGSVILLQEVYNLDSTERLIYHTRKRLGGMLAGILGDEWVRREFLVADTSLPGIYGTVTLISKNLAMILAQEEINHSIRCARGCLRVHAPASIMGRDILSVDLLLEAGEVLRICNVHLESLSLGTQSRPLQLSFASQLLQEPGVAAGIVAGDMNAIAPSDLTIHSREDTQLRDAWAEYVGTEVALSHDGENLGSKLIAEENDGEGSNWGEEKGYTWGYQSGKTEYWPRRLDKIFWRVSKSGRMGVEPVRGGRVERLGVGLEVKINKEQRREGMREGSGDKEEGEDDQEGGVVWVSDHFGLMTRFVVVLGGEGQGAAR